MIEIKAPDAAAHNLPPIAFTVDETRSGMVGTPFARPGTYLSLSGPPGGPLSFTVWPDVAGGDAWLATTIEARFGKDVRLGESAMLELAGAARQAIAFTTGSGMWQTAWCAVHVEVPEGALLVVFGAGSPKPLVPGAVAAHPSLAWLVRSFRLGAAAPPRAAYARAIGVVEDDFGPRFKLPVPKSTVSVRGWDEALAGKASLPRALGAVLGLAVGSERSRAQGAASLAAAIADVFLKQGMFSTGTVAARYLDWRRQGEVGGGVQLALDLIARGCPAERAGRVVWEKHGREPADSGALARTAVFGALFATQPALRRTLSFTDAAITHFDPACQLAAAALNAAIGHALTARPSPASMLRAAQDELREAPAAMREMYPDIGDEIDRAGAALLDDLAAVREDEPVPAVLDGNRTAFRHAFRALLHAPDFEAAFDGIDTQRGDPAVTGALVGAFYGVDAIPRASLELVLRGTIPASDATDFHARTLLRALSSGFGAHRDDAVIAQLAPYVAIACPQYGERWPDTPVPTNLIVGDGWRVTRWLRGTSTGRQARCERGAECAIASFVQAGATWRDIPDGIPGVAPLFGTHAIELDGRSFSVLVEAEPAGVPLSTPAFPMRGRQALPVFAQLIAIATAAAERGVALVGLRPEAVYVMRGASGLVIAGVLPRAETVTIAGLPSSHLDMPFSPAHLAPELARRGAVITPAVDVFSACSLFVYLTQRRSIYQTAPPRDPMRPPQPLDVTVQITGALDKAAEQAIRAGLDADPAKRPSAADIARVLATAGVVAPELPVFGPARH